MFSSKYSSFAYGINSLLFNPYCATLMRTLYRIPFIIFFGTLNATIKNTKHTKKYNNKQNIFQTTARDKA